MAKIGIGRQQQVINLNAEVLCGRHQITKGVHILIQVDMVESLDHVIATMRQTLHAFIDQLLV